VPEGVGSPRIPNVGEGIEASDETREKEAERKLSRKGPPYGRIE